MTAFRQTLKTANDLADAGLVTDEAAKDVSMHTAAMRPAALNVESLDEAEVEKERSILREAALAEGKPEEAIAVLQKGLKTSPKDATLLFTLATAQQAAKKRRRSPNDTDLEGRTLSAGDRSGGSAL